MKLKFLSLFLALGMFVLGTSVSAQDAKPAVVGAPAMDMSAPEGCPTVPWTTVITNVICKVPGLQTVAPACGKWCTGLNNGKATKADAEACMAYIESNAGQYGSIITGLIKQGCNFGCSGNVICNSCGDAANRARCGIVCCSIDPSTVKNCMSKNKDSCSNYVDTGSKEPF